MDAYQMGGNVNGRKLLKLLSGRKLDHDGHSSGVTRKRGNRVDSEKFSNANEEAANSGRQQQLLLAEHASAETSTTDVWQQVL